MSKPTSSKKMEIKKNEITSAAKTVFTKYGYKKTKIVDIAEEIGLNQASIYYYFKNKQEIFVECLIAELMVLKQKYESLVSMNTPIQDKIISLFSAKLRFFYENPIPQQLSDTNLRKISNIHKEQIFNLIEQENKGIKSLIDKAKESGELDLADTNQFVNILMHISQGIRFGNQLMLFLRQEKPNIEEMIDEMKQAVQFLFQRHM